MAWPYVRQFLAVQKVLVLWYMIVCILVIGNVSSLMPAVVFRFIRPISFSLELGRGCAATDGGELWVCDDRR